MINMEYEELAEDEMMNIEGGVVPLIAIFGGVIIGVGAGFGVGYGLAHAFG